MRANPHIFHKDTTPDITSITEAVTEADLRVQLAAAYRLVDYFGWTELIYGHLTVRVPGPEPHFLINPFGLNYDEVCASNLVKIDVDGDVVEPTAYPVNKAGFVIHSAVHMANSADNKCVMHTHTRDGMAICAIDEGLQPVSMFSTPFFNRVAYHDYEGPSFDIGERDRLQANLGDGKGHPSLKAIPPRVVAKSNGIKRGFATSNHGGSFTRFREGTKCSLLSSFVIVSGVELTMTGFKTRFVFNGRQGGFNVL